MCVTQPNHKAGIFERQFLSSIKVLDVRTGWAGDAGRPITAVGARGTVVTPRLGRIRLLACGTCLKHNKLGSEEKWDNNYTL